MFSYTATGRILVKGCANPITVKKFYEYTYGIGSVLYVLAKAARGVLEKIVVKRVNLVSSEGLVPVFNYVDTTNRVWFEDELIPPPQAVTMSIEYLESAMARLDCT